MTLVMLDTIDLNQLNGFGIVPDALAGYVNGNWPTYPHLPSHAPPGCKFLSISVNATGEAECLDVEPGDATNGAAPAWVKRAFGQGVNKPVLYTSVSNMDALVRELSLAGVPRTEVRLWSAHYGNGTHICGPSSCGLTSQHCDGTQWTDHAGGRNIDQSVLANDFFGPLASLLLDEVNGMFFLNQGPNVATPVVIPHGTARVRFGSNDTADVHVDMMTSGKDIDLKLSYAGGPQGFAVPAGCHMVIAHRVDAGPNQVSVCFSS